MNPGIVWKLPVLREIGRYGLMPVMRDRLQKDWNILLDDAKAAGKTGTLSRLADEPGINIATQTHSDGAFVWITRR